MADAPAKSFDGDAFYSAILSTVVARGVSWKKVSAETGVSPTTLTRMGQGRRPDAASLAALAAWAGLNPADFVLGCARNSTAEPLAQISRLLRTDPRLRPDDALTLDTMLQSAYARLKVREQEQQEEKTARHNPKKTGGMRHPARARRNARK